MRLDDLRYLDTHGEIARTQHLLPHWQQEHPAVYFVTFRLADALPRTLLDGWEDERVAWLSHHPKPWIAEIEREYHERFSHRIEQWLDAGSGSCLLRIPACAGIVGNTLSFFEGARTTQLAWVVMPNHVHTLFVRHIPWSLESVLSSWKRYSVREINRSLSRTGPLWQRDYFDRIIRDENHLFNCVRYIRRNPSKAGLNEGSYVLWESELAKGIE